MAEEVREFHITIPAGTAKSAGFTASLSMPTRTVEQIDIIVPPGPRGEVGFQIGSSGAQIIPIQTGTYIVTDNEVIHFPLSEQINSGGWEFYGYNNGIYDHTIMIRFLVTPTTRQTAAPAVQPIQFGTLSGGG
jgi:hypothetical protein